MKFCTNCGTQLADDAKFCRKCGTVFPEEANPYGGNTGPTYEAPNYQQPPYYEPYRPRADSGGIIAWSIVSLLLCTIPGVVGLVYATKISKATSAEEERRAVTTAKVWNTVATTLGLLYLVLVFLAKTAH